MRIVASAEIRPKVWYFCVMVYPVFWRRWLGATIETEEYFVCSDSVTYTTGGKLDGARIDALSKAMTEDIAAAMERKNLNAREM